MRFAGRVRLADAQMAGMSCVLALAVGTLAVNRSAYAALAAVGVCFVGVVALLRDRPLDELLPLGIVLVSALVGLPQRIRIGPISGLAVLTIICVVVALPFVLARLDVLRAVPLGLLAFVAYLMLSMLFAPPTHDGFQDVLVQLLFVLLIALSASASRRGALLAVRLRRLIPVAGLFGAALGLVLVGAGKAGTSNRSDVSLSARPFAIFAVIVFAWALANIRMRRRGLLLAGAMLGLIAFTLSRSGLAAAALITSVNWLRTPSLVAWVRTGLVVGVVATAGVFAIRDIPALHDRFYQGDVTSVGGFKINAEGRGVIWQRVWDRYLSSPIFGHGAGDSTTTVAAVSTAGQPHNDYLRILDDTGAVGLVLWIFGYVSLLRQASLARRIAVTELERIVAQAAFLSLLGIAVVMMFDNPMVYTFAIGPLAVLVGSAIGSAHRARDTGGLQTREPISWPR